MIIYHVINSLGTGGAERLVVDLAFEGIKQGHDVRILLLKDDIGIPRERALNLAIPIKVVGKSLKDPRIPHRIRKMTRDADVIHVHLFPALYWVAKINKPKVFTEHSTNNRRIGNPMFLRLERWAYSGYERTVAISPGVEDALKEHFSKAKISTEITMISNGISENFFNGERAYSKNPKRIVSVGSLTPVKQHELAIEAVSLLEDVTLQIAGEGKMREFLLEKIEELGVSHKVELLGNVEAISELLHQNDLFLSTSKFEGFGLAALEAQATGIPVVGPNVAGFRDVVLNGKSGVLFDSYNPREIAETIRKTLQPDLYLSLSSNSRKNAENYAVRDTFLKLLDLYREIE
ncbi:glycosyltransferase [Corynebacterium glutamicum]|uniref:glycosyltransferase n=1 Tax=Corynebacterium glutamicum TaxID=1718 RepID=UPI003B6326C4